MAKARPLTAPVLDPIHLTHLTPGDAYDLEPDAQLDGLEIADLDVGALELNGASLVTCALRRLRADEADLRSATLVESVAEGIDIPVVRGSRGRWRDVEVRSSRLGSAELYESTWSSVHLVGCRLGYLNLRGSRLTDVAFTDCTIDELDLGEATVVRLALADTRLTRLDVRSATLTHVDLRGADLSELSGLDHLRGATISTLQLQQLAPLFAASCGVEVRD